MPGPGPRGGGLASAPLMSEHPITWKETRQRLRADRARLLAVLAAEGQPRPWWLGAHRRWLAVWLFRWSHYFWMRGPRPLGRALWHLNLLLTGAEFDPTSEIDGGFTIASPMALTFNGRAGRNLTMMPLSGIGGELGRGADVGGGPGLPVLGDDVILEAHAGVLGPVRVGDRVRVRAGCVVTRDVPDDIIVEPAPARGDRA